MQIDLTPAFEIYRDRWNEFWRMICTFVGAAVGCFGAIVWAAIQKPTDPDAAVAIFSSIAIAGIVGFGIGWYVDWRAWRSWK